MRTRNSTSSSFVPASCPVTVAQTNGFFDKNWITCDDTASSRFYGRCYTAWDDFGHGNLLKIAYSTNAGQTWTLSNTPRAGVIG